MPGSYEAFDNWKLPGLTASQPQALVNDGLKTLKLYFKQFSITLKGGTKMAIEGVDIVKQLHLSERVFQWGWAP